MLKLVISYLEDNKEIMLFHSEHIAYLLFFLNEFFS